MELLNLITGLDKVGILQCEELAKKIGFDTLYFDLCGPNGRLRCKWMDAYFGFFKQVDGGECGFFRAADVAFYHDVWCENLSLDA